MVDSNKKMVIKHFADLKMHAVDKTHLSPSNHPAHNLQGKSSGPVGSRDEEHTKTGKGKNRFK